jgi:protein arginine N-methyltransferase 1
MYLPEPNPAADSEIRARHEAESRHYWMLADRVRSERLRQAVFATVKPGNVVLDVGTGTGLLSMFAVQAGAARVYAIEHCAATAGLARDVIARNSMTDRITVIEGSAIEVDLPEPVDVLLIELIGNLGSEEDIEDVAAGVATRWLKPGGRCVPERLRTFALPVQVSPRPAEVFSHRNYGLDLAVATQLPDPQPGQAFPTFARPKRLGPPVLLEDIAVGRPAPVDRTAQAVALEIDAPGHLQAVLGYFEAELAPGVRAHSFPAYPCASWTPYRFPVMPGRLVEPGQRLGFHLQRLGFHRTHTLAGFVQPLA